MSGQSIDRPPSSRALITRHRVPPGAPSSAMMVGCSLCAKSIRID